ncbi:MAG: hypothetical protein ACYCWW_01310 [Deltaproteobacteria bacterium]
MPGNDWGVVGTTTTGQCGCIEGLPLHEFAACPGAVDQYADATAECGCAAQCVGTDPHDLHCELPCSGEDDCPWNSNCEPIVVSNDPSAAACQADLCTDGGILCQNAANGNPGTCLPMWGYLGPTLYCFEGGHTNAACNPDPYLTRHYPTEACLAGYYCLPSSLDAGSCTLVCDPTAPHPYCPQGTHCGVVVDGAPTFGACVACLPRRAPCQTGADCCSGDCEPGCSFDYTENGWGPGCMECR